MGRRKPTAHDDWIARFVLQILQDRSNGRMLNLFSVSALLPPRDVLILEDDSAKVCSDGVDDLVSDVLRFIGETLIEFASLGLELSSVFGTSAFSDLAVDFLVNPSTQTLELLGNGCLKLDLGAVGKGHLGLAAKVDADGSLECDCWLLVGEGGDLEKKIITSLDQSGVGNLHVFGDLVKTSHPEPGFETLDANPVGLDVEIEGSFVFLERN